MCSPWPWRDNAPRTLPRATAERARDWPGVHCVRALLDGEPLAGYWFDRSREFAARRRGETFDRYDYATEEAVELSPLPCWQHLSEETYQKRVAGLVDEIEEDAAAERARTGQPVLGVAAILAQDPQHRPAFLDRSPCHLFLTASESMWRTLYEGYAWFVAAFRAAAEKLRAGDRDARGLIRLVEHPKSANAQLPRRPKGWSAAACGSLWRLAAAGSGILFWLPRLKLPVRAGA